MMRKSTFFWLGMTVFSAAALFHTSQQVTDGREKLAVIEHDIRKEEETLRVLQAEWSYLNQPDRLEKLVREYLQLEPMKGRQFTHMENLEAAPPPEKTAAADEAPRAEEGPGLTDDPEAAQSAATEPAAGDAAQDTTQNTTQNVAKAEEATATPKAPEKPTVNKPAVSKPATAKPAAAKVPPAKPAAPKVTTAPKPAAPPKTPEKAVEKAPEKSAASAPAAESRNFSDMMKSLGVKQ